MPYKILTKKSCDFYQQEKIIYPELAQFSDLPFPYPCPFPQGVFSINGYAPSLQNIPLVLLQTGDYAGDVRYFKDKKMVFSFRGYASVIQI